MYTIIHALWQARESFMDTRPLFVPQGPYVSQPILHMEANRFTTLEFTIYPDHPEYDRIELRLSEIRVYRDDTLMVALRPVRRKKAFNGGITYTCEEYAACMDDKLQRPTEAKFKDTDGHNAVSEFIQYVAGSSASAGTSRPIIVGNIWIQSNETINYINNDYVGTWETLQSWLVNKYGGYIVPRYVQVENSIEIYIDYLDDAHLPLCGQYIEFGKNMADMFVESDSSDMFNVLIPLGKDLKLSDTSDGQPIYWPLTIEDVNEGKDYLENTASVALYGRREKVQKWEDIESASELKKIAKQYLDTANTGLQTSVTLSAADLHILNVDIDAFSCMQRVYIYSPLYGIQTIYTVTAMQLPLGEPKLLSMTLGDTKDVMTDRLTQSKSSSRKASQSSKSTNRSDRAASADTQVRHDKSIIRNQRDIDALDKRVSLVVNTTPAIKAADIVAAISRTPNLSLTVTGDLICNNSVLISGALTCYNSVSISGNLEVYNEEETLGIIGCNNLIISGDRANDGKLTCRKVDTEILRVDSITYVASSTTIESYNLSNQHNFMYDDGNGHTGTVSGRLVTEVVDTILYYLRGGE